MPTSEAQGGWFARIPLHYRYWLCRAYTAGLCGSLETQLKIGGNARSRERALAVEAASETRQRQGCCLPQAAAHRAAKCLYFVTEQIVNNNNKLSNA